MNKTLVLLGAALLGGLNAGAQTTAKEPEEKKSTVEKPSRDFVMIKITTGGWADKPDSVSTKNLGRGFAISLMYDFPIKKSNFSFAAGLGINAQNVYLDGQNINFKDTGSQSIFFASSAYKRYKLTTTRLEMPLELRFFGNNKNRNVGFKAAVGANIGLTIGSHTKGVSGSGGSKYSDKVVTRRFIQQWDFAPTMRIGYGNFSVYGSYSLTPLFKENAGPQVVQYSIGICLTGL
ncbi:outer membrane beta-barrel protein [Rurimicrobium arvi]